MPSRAPQGHSHNPLKRPRQDPVSCGFCRSKKLKCDRQQPCANCAARSLTCDIEPHLRPLADSSSLCSENNSVLARLKRLEDIVLGQSEQHPVVVDPTNHPRPPRTKHTSSIVDQPTSTSEYEEAVYSLEEVGARQKPFQNIPTPHKSIRYSASHISFDQAVHYQHGSTSFFLPPEHDGHLLLDRYKSRIGELQYVLHYPSVRVMMDALYKDMDQGTSVTHSHVALLFSIFASAAALGSSSPDDMPMSPFVNAPPSEVSVSWAYAALEVLDHSRRTTTGSLEDIQASLVLGFLLYHLDGFSANLRYLLTGALAMARDISLHRTDMPAAHVTSYVNRPSPLEKEIRRRVWWYLASTDWLLALNGGPQERTYLVHPRHMRVNYPRNINDEDMMHEDHAFDRPLSQPTTMSYYIQRIKLAELSRRIVDTMPPLCNLDLSTVDYQEIVALDHDIDSFFDKLPTFLKTDAKSRLQSAHLLHPHPQIHIQRWGLGMMAHVTRCKLHQPFLVRRRSSQHAFSRDASLRSARAVIEMKRLLEAETDRGPGMNPTVKFTWPVHHVFLATIVLVMDLCFNRDPHDYETRKAEVLEACRVLEDSGAQSDKTSRFLDSLMDVLRRYRVQLYHPASSDPVPAAATKVNGDDRLTTVTMTGQFGAGDALAQSMHETNTRQNQQQQQQSFDVPDFDQVWRDYVELGPNLDTSQWENLFSDLDLKY